MTFFISHSRFNIFRLEQATLQARSAIDKVREHQPACGLESRLPLFLLPPYNPPVGDGFTTLLSSAYFMFSLVVLGYFHQISKLSIYGYIRSVSTTRVGLLMQTPNFVWLILPPYNPPVGDGGTLLLFSAYFMLLLVVFGYFVKFKAQNCYMHSIRKHKPQRSLQRHQTSFG